MHFDDRKQEELLNNPGIIRNRLKIRAAIRNAAVFNEIQNEYGSFAAYLRKYCGEEIIYEVGPATSPISDAISRDLQKRGMKFCGSTIIYAYLQAVGLINAHEPACWLYSDAK